MEKSLKYLDEIIELAAKIEEEEQRARQRKGLAALSGEPPVLFHLKNLRKLMTDEQERINARTTPS